MKLPSGKEVFPNTKITENFTWGEATKDCTRRPPSLEVEQNIVNSAIQLQKIRNQFNRPIQVTSWYRDPASNRIAGGVKNSEHLSGHAIDFIVRGMTSYAVYLRLINHPGGLGWYRGGWCHIDFRNWEGKGAARWNG